MGGAYAHIFEDLLQVITTVGRMYKGSEPIRLEHVLWMVRSRSEISEVSELSVQSLGIVFIEILLIFDNYHILECFWGKQILGNVFVCKQTSDE